MKITLPPQAPINKSSTMGADESKKLKGALQDFESLFLFYMLKECFKPNMGSHPGSHIYQDLVREAFSCQLSENGGLGLAHSLEKNFNSSPNRVKK
ncbi:MAG: hypothetical protein ACMUJM_10740 [bacterium]